MAGILDSLVSHLEARIVSGDSKERVSSEVLAEFLSDIPVSSVPKAANPVQETIASPIQVLPKTTEVESVKVEVSQEKPEEKFVPAPMEEKTAPEPVKVVDVEEISQMSLEQLRHSGNSCSACNFSLGEKRSQNTALNSSARLMIISEPSGRTDDHMTDPFHGEAGDLLLKMVSAMKINLDELYMCMAHKCFGPGAREKIIETKPFLERQIELVKPEVILIFGGAALNILIGEQSLMKNRGRWLDVLGVPTMATYPPAYLQQKAAAKKEAWSDMQQVMARLKL